MLPPSARSYGTLISLRRAIPLLACCVALIAVAPAAARFVPVQHNGPRVTAGTLPTLTGAATRVRVVVGLALPPLSLRQERGLRSVAARRKLDVASSSSRAYV